jgi:hypothetical protein
MAYNKTNFMENQNLFDLQVDPASHAYLAESAKWGKFLSIVGFIMCGFIAIAAFFVGSLLAAFAPGGVDAVNGAMGATMTVSYLLGALLYFFPCLYLFNYSKKVKEALLSSNQDVLAKAFSNLKSLFKFMGILTIIGLAFMSIFVIIAIVVAAASLHGQA